MVDESKWSTTRPISQNWNLEILRGKFSEEIFTQNSGTPRDFSCCLRPKMNSDELIWNTVNYDFCSYKVKYLLIINKADEELKRRRSVEMNIMSLDFAQDSPVHYFPSTPLSEKKTVDSICTSKPLNACTVQQDGGKKSNYHKTIKLPWLKLTNDWNSIPCSSNINVNNV